jgi:hypothetical protein
MTADLQWPRIYRGGGGALFYTLGGRQSDSRKSNSHFLPWLLSPFLQKWHFSSVTHQHGAGITMGQWRMTFSAEWPRHWKVTRGSIKKNTPAQLYYSVVRFVFTIAVSEISIFVNVAILDPLSSWMFRRRIGAVAHPRWTETSIRQLRKRRNSHLWPYSYRVVARDLYPFGINSGLWKLTCGSCKPIVIRLFTLISYTAFQARVA